MKNKCDECGGDLEKTFINSDEGLPVVCWVCPKSEIYQAYREWFEKRWHTAHKK